MCKFLQTLLGNELTLESQLKQDIQFYLLFCYVAKMLKTCWVQYAFYLWILKKKKKEKEN